MILTGEYGAPVLEPLVDELAAAAGAPVDVRPVANRFFGGNIAVTGLLTGPDVARALDEHRRRRARARSPTSCSRTAASSTTPRPPTCPRPVEVVATDGASLVAGAPRTSDAA